MRRYLRSDATLLLPEAYSDIINAKGKKNILPVLAKKYKISSRRVYQIWREQEYPPLVLAWLTKIMIEIKKLKAYIIYMLNFLANEWMNFSAKPL